MPKSEPEFLPGSCKELNAIHAVMMGVGDDWPDVESDPYTLRHVKWMARQLNASVSRDNKVEKLRQSLLTIWRSGVDDLDHHCRYPALEFFGCKHFHELENLAPAASVSEQQAEAAPVAQPGSAVNHPAHYNAHPSGIECIDVVEHMGFNVGNAVKYLWRADLKGNALEDLEKARWYVQREIDKRQLETVNLDA